MITKIITYVQEKRKQFIRFVKFEYACMFKARNFVSLDFELEEINKLPDSKEKFLQFADIYKRYSNGFAICACYGEKYASKSYIEFANYYSKLSDVNIELSRTK